MVSASLRERYRQLPWQQQLGNLASTLARISARARTPQSDTLVRAWLREAALFIEWSAPHVPPDLLEDLAACQRELMVWWRVWPLDPARGLLSLYASHTSERLLRAAGLVQTQ